MLSRTQNLNLSCVKCGLIGLEAIGSVLNKRPAVGKISSTILNVNMFVKLPMVTSITEVIGRTSR